MNTNDIKKGWLIMLHDGAVGIMKDNKRGNVRLVYARGELGSVYAHDIWYARQTPDEAWVCIKHTPAQLKCKELNKALFGG